MSSAGEVFPFFSISALIERHLGHLGERKYSSGSISHMRTNLGDFAFYCNRRGIEEPGGVGKEELGEYLSYLNGVFVSKRDGRRLCRVTVANKWWSLYLFFEYLMSSGVITWNPVLLTAAPRLDFTRRSRDGALTYGEISLFLSTPDMSTKLGLRDRAMLEMFYGTGMKGGELMALTLSDIDLEKNIAHMERDGSNGGLAPIGEVATFYLKRYLEKARRELCVKNPQCGTIFLGRGGRRLTHAALHGLMRKYREKSGIKKRINSHVIRNTFILHMLSGGAPVIAIREILGHRGVCAASGYTPSSAEFLVDVHRRCHPRGSWRLPGDRPDEL